VLTCGKGYRGDPIFLHIMNEKTSILIESKSLLSLLIILFVLFVPFSTYAATYYRCVGKAGGVSIADYPIDGQSCEPVGTIKEMTDEERMKDQKERDEQEKRRTEEYEKRIADEAAKRKNANVLNDCYEKARIRHTECVGAVSGMYDQSAWNSAVMRCDDNHQRERNQCIQQYP